VTRAGQSVTAIEVKSGRTRDAHPGCRGSSLCGNRACWQESKKPGPLDFKYLGKADGALGRTSTRLKLRAGDGQRAKIVLKGRARHRAACARSHGTGPHGTAACEPQLARAIAGERAVVSRPA